MAYLTSVHNAKKFHKTEALNKVIPEINYKIEQMASTGNTRIVLDLLTFRLAPEAETVLIQKLVDCGYSVKRIDDIDKCFIVSWAEQEE